MTQLTLGSVGEYSVQPEMSSLGAFQTQLHDMSKSELIQLRNMVSSCLSKLGSAGGINSGAITDDFKLDCLTKREIDVLTLIAKGYTRPEIALVLCISRNTAATHVSNIYRKLEIDSIAEATLLAVRWGIVS